MCSIERALQWTDLDDMPDEMCETAAVRARKNLVAMVCASAHIITMFPNEELAARHTKSVGCHRRLDLVARPKDAKFVMLGLQDTILRWARGSGTGPYHVFAAPAGTCGQGGLELSILMSWFAFMLRQLADGIVRCYWITQLKLSLTEAQAELHKVKPGDGARRWHRLCRCDPIDITVPPIKRSGIVVTIGRGAMR